MSQGSQQSHSYYVDDIPIMITEKWRLPPLPNISDELIRPFFKDRQTGIVDDESDHQGQYNFTLEQKVLDKIDEWKSLREKELYEREERLKLRREELQKRIEVEESRLKERLTQVTYPDEFSSSSSDEGDEQELKQESKQEDDQVYQGTFFDSILKPTVIQSRPSSATDVQQRAKRSQAGSLWSGRDNASKIELADFENDATDPFYNVELKTIDDLDVLAQVLKSSNLLHSKEKSKGKNKNDDNNKHEQEKGHVDQVKHESENKEINEPTTQVPVNGFVLPSPASVASSFQSYTSYASNYVNYCPVVSNGNQTFISATNGGFGNGFTVPVSLNSAYAPNYNTTYLPNVSYQQFNQHSYQPNPQEPQPVSNLMESKLRSKSVPDICQELDAEVKDSERRRIRNNSQSVETARNTAHNSRLMAENNSNDGVVATKNKNCDEFLKPLPIELQNLIRNISQMGFPIDLVFRVAEQFQGDDKRVSINISTGPRVIVLLGNLFFNPRAVALLGNLLFIA